jgi:hypothetical protein
MRRSVLFSVVYGIAFALAADMFIKNPSGFMGPIIMAISLGLIASLWIKPFIVRNKLASTITGLYEEKYIAKFYDNKIVIETKVFKPGAGTITEDINQAADETDERGKPSEETETIIPTEINIATEQLVSMEDDEMFLLFVNRSLIYIFPKRCLNGEQIEELSKYFRDKAI